MNSAVVFPLRSFGHHSYLSAEARAIIAFECSIRIDIVPTNNFFLTAHGHKQAGFVKVRSQILFVDSL